MAGFFRAALMLALACFMVGAILIVSAPSADAVGAEGEGWPSFNESDGCGSPWMRGPSVEASGWLSPSTILRGPHADYFGRSIQQVWDSLIWWNVPMSDGERLRLHERMLPGLREVEANLAEAASDGNRYSIVSRYTYGYAARTVGGSYRVSQHGLGNAIDINANKNPYTTGSLRTNMPVWFREAFQDAGYCWGGAWQSAKDAMHFNWKGPLFTPGVTSLPLSYPPKTAPESFTRTMHSESVPGTLQGTRYRLLMDADNDGAVDVVNVSDGVSGSVIDVLSARSGYQGCSVARYPAPALTDGVAAINGDWDRDGAQDLWIIDDRDGVAVTAYLRFGDFSQTASTTIPTEAGDRYLAADHDVDGWTDLYILRFDGGRWAVEVRDGASRFRDVLATGSITGAQDLMFSALDRDRDQVPDLIGVGASASLIADGASGFSEVESLPGVRGTYDDIAGSDFDGDGRHDLATLDGTSLRVFAGNTRLAGVAVTSWFEFPEYRCSGTSLPYPYRGTFRDDDTSVHEDNIEAIAARGVTVGCNPPIRDEFCTRRGITRGELAAFIKRSLALPATTIDAYVDDGDSIFEDDINRLAAAGITVSCNSAGDRFCPDDVVARDVMAQFLVAAFGYPASAVDWFSDDDASPHHSDINAIAAVGVTRGCNPPANDLFCPDRDVTRAEMASFLMRALRLREG